MEPHAEPSSTEPPPTTEDPPPPSSSTPSSSSLPPPNSTSDPSSPIPPQNPTTLPPTLTPSQPQPQPQPIQSQQQRPLLSQSRPHSPFTQPSLPSSATSTPRGGLAIGVPAQHHQRPPHTLSPFGAPTPFSRPFSPMPRASVGGTDPSTISNSQVRQPIQGMHSIGTIGSQSIPSHIRPSGILGQQQRFTPSSLRATPPSANQSLSSQVHKLHSQSLSRAPGMTSANSPAPVPQSSQPFHQPLQGKQINAASLPSSSYKPQMKPQTSLQRPNLPQQHHQSIGPISHQQKPASLSQQPQEHHSQQYQVLRNQQPLPQQQAARAHGSIPQKSNIGTLMQSGVGASIDTTNAAESGNKILSKRSIHELVNEIDPFEKLDSEVEDVLMEIADDFIDSITTFACSLAKHRKSTTLEAKDILLHVERNWNITLPGFGGDEIKCFKKQPTNDIHRERLSVVKKSMAVSSDAGNVKNPPTTQAAVNRKAHVGKTPATSS